MSSEPDAPSTGCDTPSSVPQQEIEEDDAAAAGPVDDDESIDAEADDVDQVDRCDQLSLEACDAQPARPGSAKKRRRKQPLHPDYRQTLGDVDAQIDAWKRHGKLSRLPHKSIHDLIKAGVRKRDVVDNFSLELFELLDYYYRQEEKAASDEEHIVSLQQEITAFAEARSSAGQRRSTSPDQTASSSVAPENITEISSTNASSSTVADITESTQTQAATSTQTQTQTQTATATATATATQTQTQTSTSTQTQTQTQTATSTQTAIATSTETSIRPSIFDHNGTELRLPVLPDSLAAAMDEDRLSSTWERPGSIWRLWIPYDVKLTLQDRTLAWSRADSSQERNSVFLDPLIVRLESNRYEQTLVLHIRTSYPRQGPVRQEQFSCKQTSIFVAYEQAIAKRLGALSLPRDIDAVLPLPAAGELPADECADAKAELRAIVRHGNPKQLLTRSLELGKGAFGVVLLACDTTQAGLHVAVKELLVSAQQSERRHFEHEILLHAQLSHPNVVDFFYALVWENKLHLVVNYCDGGSLADLHRYSIVQEQHIAYVLRGLLHGLAYLHSVNVIHRDIKPENILLTSSGQVQLADFGLAVHAKPGCRHHAGTIGYLSPQILRHDPYGCTTDVFSAGCIMYRLAYAQYLFDYSPHLLFQMFHTAFSKRIHPAPPPGHERRRPTLSLSSGALAILADMLEPDDRVRKSAGELLAHPFLQTACCRQEMLAAIEIAMSGVMLSRMGF